MSALSSHMTSVFICIIATATHSNLVPMQMPPVQQASARIGDFLLVFGQVWLDSQPQEVSGKVLALKDTDPTQH